jgi:hypothetical protein
MNYGHKRQKNAPGTKIPGAFFLKIFCCSCNAKTPPLKRPWMFCKKHHCYACAVGPPKFIGSTCGVFLKRADL